MKSPYGFLLKDFDIHAALSAFIAGSEVDGADGSGRLPLFTGKYTPSAPALKPAHLFDAYG